MIKNVTKPFYAEGLHFGCTRCSVCCRHTPGYVFLSFNDLNRLLLSTRMKKEEFLRVYCRNILTIHGNKISLKEKQNYDCIFWSLEGCIHYESRPFQCRSFPFWKSHLGSPGKWQNLKSFCPGVGKGTLHSKEVIEDWLDKVKQEEYYY